MGRLRGRKIGGKQRPQREKKRVEQPFPGLAESDREYERDFIIDPIGKM